VSRPTFRIGQHVRYAPGYGTYGYEDCLEDDGRLPGIVRGFTRTRVQVELTLAKRGPKATKRAAVAAESLTAALCRDQYIHNGRIVDCLLELHHAGDHIATEIARWPR
jgi:hypothetical protein